MEGPAHMLAGGPAREAGRRPGKLGGGGSGSPSGLLIPTHCK